MLPHYCIRFVFKEFSIQLPWLPGYFELLAIACPHKLACVSPTSLQYTFYVQKLCNGNMPEMFLEQYGTFFEKLNKLCK